MSVRIGERSCDEWARMLNSARQLDDNQLRHHARISLKSNHGCTECFTCACQAVVEERRRYRRR